jgi:hypothetical protein
MLRLARDDIKGARFFCHPGETQFFFSILSEVSNANEVEWISNSFA